MPGGVVNTGETDRIWSERGASREEKKLAMEASKKSVELFGPKGRLKGKSRSNFKSIEEIMDA